MTINITEEFKKFIESAAEEVRDIFEYYCLGIRKNGETVNVMTYGQYYENLRYCISNNTDRGLRTVFWKKYGIREMLQYLQENNDYYGTYDKSINLQKVPSNRNVLNYIKNIVNQYSRTHILSCFVKKGNPHAYPDYTIESIINNPGQLFFIHPDIKSIDEDELLTLLLEWDDYLDNILYDSKNIDFEYRYVLANKDEIYRSSMFITANLAKRIRATTSTVTLPLKCSFHESAASIRKYYNCFNF